MANRFPTLQTDGPAMMRSYPILCTCDGCRIPAEYKIAARWSDGITSELKTYALCCSQCLPQAYRRSCAKRDACRMAPAETLDRPGIHELKRGLRDSQLVRREDLE